MQPDHQGKCKNDDKPQEKVRGPIAKSKSKRMSIAVYPGLGCRDSKRTKVLKAQGEPDHAATAQRSRKAMAKFARGCESVPARVYDWNYSSAKTFMCIYIYIINIYIIIYP